MTTRTTKTCKECGHVWLPRAGSSPSKCPRCQAPFKEGIALPPVPVPAISSDESAQITFLPRLYLPSHKFATMDDQKWEQLEEEAIADYKRWLKEMRVLHKERQRQHVAELADRIIERNRSIRRMLSLDPLSHLRSKLHNVRRRNLVERQKERWVDKLKELQNWNQDAEFDKWMKETKTARHHVGRSTIFKPEEFAQKLKEDAEIVKLATPIFQEIVVAHEERIAELQQAEVDVVPLVKKANEIRDKAVKLIEEESKVIDQMCEAHDFGREAEVDQLLPSYRRLSADINKLDAEHRALCVKIQEMRIDPPDLLSFPIRKTAKLQIRDRIVRKL